MFGDPTNLEVAEYVFHALLNQGEALYEDFKKNHIAIKGRKISKASYFAGLMSGYKLKMEKFQNTNTDENDKSLIHMSDKMLKDLFEKEYNVRYNKSNGSCGLGYSNGESDSKKLNISSGVKSRNSGYLLTA